MKFNSKLKELRESLGLSLYKVAKDLELNWHTLEAIEKGTAQKVSVSVLRKIKFYYNVSLDLILDLSEDDIMDEKK